MINQNPDYFEAMETQYLVQNEIEQDDKYYIHYGLCPQCKGSGEIIDTRGFGMEHCCDCSETKISKEDNEL